MGSEVGPRHLEAVAELVAAVEGAGGRTKMVDELEHGNGGVYVSLDVHLPVDYTPLDENDE